MLLFKALVRDEPPKMRIAKFWLKKLNISDIRKVDISYYCMVQSTFRY